MAATPISTVFYARKEGESGARLRYVGIELQPPLLAAVIHLDPRWPDAPDELAIGVNASLPTPAPQPAPEVRSREAKLEAEITSMRDRLLKAQARIGLLQRRLSGLLTHRAAKDDAVAPSVVDLYREVLKEERAHDREGNTRSTPKRFVKKKR